MNDELEVTFILGGYEFGVATTLLGVAIISFLWLVTALSSGIFFRLMLWVSSISTIAFAMMLADKAYAEEGEWRIPEAVLIAVSLAGGCYGILSGALVARHKTIKTAFWPPHVAALIIWTIILFMLAIL